MFLLFLFFILRSIVRMTGFFPLAIPAYLILAYSLFRFFSPNLMKRQSENARFLAIFQSVVRWIRFQRSVMADKEHRYFKCPNCGQPLRVPRGKGKLQITCRACGAQFEEKS
jgi:ribosomal protein L37AE/L43A